MENMRKKIENLVIEALADCYEEFGTELEANLQSFIFGGDSPLDSTAVVSFLVDLEARMEDEMDIVVSFTDERAFSQEHSPFHDVTSMTDYILVLYEENRGE